MNLKVLHIVYSLDPGGMENGILNLARNLPPERVTLEVCCLDKAGRMSARFPNPSRLHVLGKRHGFDLRTGWSLCKKIRETQPDILHTHNLGPLIYAILAKSMGAGVRILHGEHAELTRTDLGFRKRLQRKILYRFCHRIHTVGLGMTRQIQALKLSKSSILTLQNGVDVEKFRPCGEKDKLRRELLGVSGDAVVAGIFGRFGRYKRHNFVLDAFARLGGDFPNLHLLVVGGGGDHEQQVLRAIDAHPFSQRIQAVGFHPDPLPYYQCLDLLLIPSVNEGLSNCALEAMACGVPVLSNRSCGSEELIKDGEDGFLHKIGSIGDLENIISSLLDAGLLKLQTVGCHARAKAKAGFSLARMMHDYLQVYEDFASKRG